MGRPIRFRAWNKEKNSMDYDVETNYVYSDLNGAIKCAQNEIGLILMQFTGLHDKNGLEIYEGDILEYEESKRKFQVEWENESSCYYAYFVGIPANNPYISKLGGWELDRAKIIGNIYENPELLNG